MTTKMKEDLLQKTKFVFRGTVEQVNAANVAQVENTDQTAIVFVDEIIKSPQVLGNFAGKSITVKLGDKEVVKKGEKAIFYTNGWLFGETIAVESLGHSQVDAEIKSLSAANTDPAKFSKNSIIKDRLKTADAVVSGRVVSVRLTPENLENPLAAVHALDKGDETVNRRPISEHDPQWCEAVVEVADTDKGDDKKQVVVRFPSSNDVRWYKAHKFAAGDEGVFILHKTEPLKKSVTQRIAATVTNDEAETDEETFTALHPEDFQPLQNVPEIKTLIKDVE